MNRRSARTNADILEALSVFLDILREEIEDESPIKGKHSIVFTPLNKGKDDYLEKINKRLLSSESSIVVLPNDLSSSGIDATSQKVSPEEAKKREAKTRNSLCRLAKIRGQLHGHDEETIEKMVRADLEVLRKKTTSTENHGVSFINKCLYHVSGASKVFRLDEETMRQIEPLTIIEKIPGKSASYKITLTEENAEGAAISKRIMELRKLCKTSEEVKKEKKEKEEKEVGSYMQRIAKEYKAKKEEVKIKDKESAKKQAS